MGKVTLVWGSRDQNSGCFYSVGNLDVTGSYVMMTLHQDVSVPVHAGESICGDFVDGSMS